MHAVHRLYHYRKSLSTTEYKSRGHKLKRCELCQVALAHCLCSLVPNTESQVSFLLLMYDTEVMKPSNTGRLIADVIPDTHAYLWSRTEPNEALLTLLNDDKWQPYIVFPKDYVNDVNAKREVIERDIPAVNNKRPLFIMLDGSWREAKKMFRKSPYLANFPVVSFSPDDFDEEGMFSRYHLRKAANNTQLATAEVAARILAMAGEEHNAKLLDLWFDVFSYQYQKSVGQKNQGNKQALEHYLSFVNDDKKS